MASELPGKKRGVLSRTTVFVILILSTIGGGFIGWGRLPVEWLWLPALCGTGGGVIVCIYLTWIRRPKAERELHLRHPAVLFLYSLLLTGGVLVVLIEAKPEHRYSAILGVSLVMVGASGLVDTFNRRSSKVEQTEHEHNTH